MCLKLGPEATSDFRSRFTSKEQETAMKFPRDKVQEDMLAVIDSCKCLSNHFYMHYYKKIELAISFVIDRKRTVNFRNQRL